MALDRNNKETYYMIGRLIAITEHYAKPKFGPGTLTKMFDYPRDFIGAFNRYVDKSDVYLQDVADVNLPLRVAEGIDKGKMWIGYYQQKAAYDDNTAGGYRPGSGRPEGDRKIAISVRISPEAAGKLDKVSNKSETIDRLIKDNL